MAKKATWDRDDAEEKGKKRQSELFQTEYMSDFPEANNEAACLSLDGGKENDILRLHAKLSDKPVSGFSMHSMPIPKSLSDFDYGKSSKQSPKDRPIMADTMPPLPSDPEDLLLLRNQILIERVNERIHISAIAIDQPKNNNIHSILAYGDSLGGCAYDTASDAFLVNCREFIALGTVPVAFRIGVPGYSGKQIIPLPEDLILKYFAPTQRRLFRLFKENHTDCEIKFIQSLCRE